MPEESAAEGGVPPEEAACPSEERIWQYVAGSVDAELVTAVQRHLDVCTCCCLVVGGAADAFARGDWAIPAPAVPGVERPAVRRSSVLVGAALVLTMAAAALIDLVARRAR
jgi:hypothetical protein